MKDSKNNKDFIGKIFVGRRLYAEKKAPARMREGAADVRRAPGPVYGRSGLLDQ
jgi:hypothetical protein